MAQCADDLKGIGECAMNGKQEDPNVLLNTWRTLHTAPMKASQGTL